MCGRMTQKHSAKQVAQRFFADVGGLDSRPRYNVAPSQVVPVVIQAGAGRQLLPCTWGLIPSWAKDPTIAARLINARAETLADKPSFRGALRHRRCLVPADGFFEWQTIGRRRVPMYIRLKSDDLFALAGLWEEWHAPDGSLIHSCTVVTVPPNELLAPIHNRMPAILRPQDEAAWLDVAGTPPADATRLLQPYPADQMECFAVSRLVNSPGADTPACIAPATDAERPDDGRGIPRVPPAPAPPVQAELF